MAQIMCKLLEVGEAPHSYCACPDVAINADSNIRKRIFSNRYFFVIKVYNLKVLQNANMHNTMIRGQKGKITCPA
jgi:hypothetical protein